MTDDLTEDGFLGGRLRLLQPATGYRAGVDPVFLAAAVPARPGQSVLDLGCGVGTAALCLGARVPGLSLAGLERQPDYARLARENAARNDIPLEVHEGDVAAPPPDLRARSFDHVILNPPYWEPAKRTRADDGGRETALAEETPLAAWIDAALRRLRPGGHLTVIQAAERLPALLSGIDTRAGGVTIRPLSPRTGRNATRIILTARKTSGEGFTLAAPTLIHEGARHERDAEDYTPEIRAILRDGAAFSWALD